MVRNYKRKTEKGQGYATVDLEMAAKKVRSGDKSVRAAAAEFKLPRTTLRHHLNGTRGKGQAGGGLPSCLSKKEEEEIVDCLQIMDKNGFALSHKDLLDVIEWYIKQNDIKSRFKDSRPGRDWLISFKRRHNLSSNTPQSTKHIRSNPFVIHDFFDTLEKIIVDNGLANKSGHIYSCDETFFFHGSSKTEIIGGSTRKVCESGRGNTAVLVCCAADGTMLPLFCAFTEKYVTENWISSEVTAVAVSVAERGWMATQLFYNWFKDIFLETISKERPVLLMYDGNVSHVSTDLIRLAVENEVILMSLPPHTTDLLQPCDREMKSQWDKKLCTWQRNNPGKKIPKLEFAKLLEAVAKEVPKESVQNAFRRTGIYDSNLKGPNRKAINQHSFYKHVLKRPKEMTAVSTAPQQPTEQTASCSNIGNAEPATSSFQSILLQVLTRSKRSPKKISTSVKYSPNTTKKLGKSKLTESMSSTALYEPEASLDSEAFPAIQPIKLEIIETSDDENPSNDDTLIKSEITVKDEPPHDWNEAIADN